jgi:hypothetical protein
MYTLLNLQGRALIGLTIPSPQITSDFAPADGILIRQDTDRR